MKQSTSIRLALKIRSVSCSVCHQLNVCLTFKNEVLLNLESAYWDAVIAKDFTRSETVSDGDS